MTNVQQNSESNNLHSRKSNVVAIDHLNKLKPAELADDQLVGDRFVEIYNKVHGTQNGETVYNSEKFYYMKQLQENPVLRECTAVSLYGAFLDVAVNGLSFDPSKKLCYLLTRNVNIAQKGAQPIWEKRCYLAIAPDGEITMRQTKGQIKNVDNPIIVYDGDHFDILSGVNGTVVNYKAKLPRKPDARIIGGFIRITRPDNTIDFSVMLQADIDRLAAYSAKQNTNTGANALYSSGPGKQIDTGFLMAKIKKHAFDSYPKVIKGNFAISAPLPGEPKQLEENIDYYNLGNEQQPAQIEQNAPSFDAQPEAAAAAKNTVQHEDDGSGF